MGNHGAGYYEKYSRRERRQSRMQLLSYVMLAALVLATIPVVLMALNK